MNFGEQLTDAKRSPAGANRIPIGAAEQAVWLLADKGRAWEADLYRLAAECRAADVSRSGQR
jgi:hypothetical protein